MSTLDLIDRGRLCRIYNGVENSPPHNAWQAGLEFRRRFGILPDCPLVIQVSWIIPAKGIDDFLEAAHLVVGRRSDVRFAIVGEGDTRPDYARRAIELGLERHVTWTGLVEDPYNEGVYAAADVICQVSRWQEAFGCTIAEAMMFERPLVATRVGGIPELVCDSVSGFLAAPGDATAIAEHILALVADAELRRTMGECGRTFAVKHFNLRANVAKLLKLYGIAVP
jgi:glycosyltransferase involved in cell wall biosynthesis